MAHGRSGCQPPTQSEKTSAQKVDEPAAVIKNGHKESKPLLSKEGNLCPELACLSCLSFRGARGFSALSLNLKGSMRKLHSPTKGANSGIAWMTLPGLLVDADDVISDGIVKLTGPKETVAWNGFAPLQKVLVVAVTAAAATAAKQKYFKELRNLEHAIDLKDKDLEILRGKIGQLQEHLSFWKEQAQNLSKEAKESGDEVFSSENGLSLLKLGLESTPKGDALRLEQFDTPQIGNGLKQMPDRVACLRKNMRAASFRKSSYRFGSTISSERSNEDHHEIRTFLDRLSESHSINGGPFDAPTPELLVTKLCMLDTPQLPCNNVFCPQVDHVNRFFQKEGRNMAEDSLTTPMPWLELLLQLKGVMRQIQDNEAPELMSALASVKEKVQMLESKNSSQHEDLSPSCHTETVTDLSGSIDQALAKFSLLQRTVGDLRNVLGEDPNATEENAFIAMLGKSKGLFSTSRDLSLSCAKDQERDQKKVGSAVVDLVVNSTVDSLLTPLCGRSQSDSDGWSSEILIEQLLGELESAAAKVATMEAQINLLKDTELKKEGCAPILDKSTCDTCLEFDSKVRLLEDAEKKLATCREACKKREKAISRLENENLTLQEIVSELRAIQVTPKVVTSNMLFNLDSPVKIDSPHRATSPFCSWRRLDELSSTFLEGNSMKGSCDSDMYISESGNHESRSEGFNNESGSELHSAAMYRSADDNDHMLHTQGDHNEPRSIHDVPRAINCNNITFRRGSTMKEYAMDRSCDEEVSCRSSSGTDDLSRKSGISSTRSSSDNSSSCSVANARLPRPPRNYSSHARKLKFTHANDLRFSHDSGRSQTSHRRRDAGGSHLNGKASNVLAGVEPNTPMRDRNSSNGSKENFLGHSIDSLSKAKENFLQRRRWI
ncbi:hypothetical protein GOP47_0012353 [Adiantum capillus-veneris]|uniref:Uncharacterized protein n=1 Tax=Adiantum capillus-veneris TaxID=13818 RepID=A0A9D4ZFL4_ADICA|nr:hypothetical protein GOP47_0012353 [Adiantum capillus-veneris]